MGRATFDERYKVHDSEKGIGNKLLIPAFVLPSLINFVSLIDV